MSILSLTEQIAVISRYTFAKSRGKHFRNINKLTPKIEKVKTIEK